MTAVKALLYVLMAVVGSSAAVFTADGWAGSAWWNVVVLAIGAAGVWWKSNTPTQPWAKCIVAVFTAGAAVLVSAWTDRRIEPVEIQQIVLAVLGAALVGASQNNITTPGPRLDRGAAQARLALALSGVGVLVLGFGLLGADSVQASTAHSGQHAGAASAAHPVHGRPVVAPVVTRTGICDDTLYVHFAAYQLNGPRTWTAAPDDGRARLELLELSGRSAPDGMWEQIGDVGSGGEHVLRWAGFGRAGGFGQHYAMARVVVGGYRSERVPIEDRCAA